MTKIIPKMDFFMQIFELIQRCHINSVKIQVYLGADNSSFNSVLFRKFSKYNKNVMK